MDSLAIALDQISLGRTVSERYYDFLAIIPACRQNRFVIFRHNDYPFYGIRTYPMFSRIQKPAISKPIHTLLFS